MKKLTNSFKLMKSSLKVLAHNKRFLLIPIISGIFLAILAISFYKPISAIFIQPKLLEGVTQHDNSAYWITLSSFFAMYFISYVIILLFNSALVYAAYHAMQGKTVSLSEAIQHSFSRTPAIIGWALLCATIGVIVRVFEERNNRLGKLMVFFIGLTWSVASFLVIPIMIIENKGPIKALKTSSELLKNTWGEQIIGNAGFGILFSLVVTPLVLVGLFTMSSSETWIKTTGLAVAIGGLLLAQLLQSVLSAIYQAAIYNYVNNQKSCEEFDVESLTESVVQR